MISKFEIAHRCWEIEKALSRQQGVTVTELCAILGFHPRSWNHAKKWIDSISCIRTVVELDARYSEGVCSGRMAIAYKIIKI